MTCAEAVSFYHSLLRFGVRPGLERIRALCAELGDPQRGLRFIHVAGTNGKGSVCAMLAAALQAAGCRVGLYTSPYVIDFRERLRLNGEMIPPDALAEVTETVSRAVHVCNDRGIFPTEFEAITAAAFAYYAREGCDVVVLETGLGGRFDATNLIDSPLAAVITSISLDHVAVLGDTLSRIASEKAGIIKPGAPIVTSAYQPEEALEAIKARAREAGAPLVLTDRRKELTVLSRDITGSEILYLGDPYRVPFPGVHQLENAALALKTLSLLNGCGMRITHTAAREGIARAFMPARTELLCPAPPILLDGSHNEGSIRALSAVLKEHLHNKKLLGILGMMADKDISELTPLFAGIVCATPSNPRAIASETLCDMVRAKGVPAFSVPDPAAAFDTALEKLPAYDALVICGSLYLAGDLRAYTLARIRALRSGAD